VRIQAVLFDFGHTIVDFGPTEQARLAAYTKIRDRLAGWVEEQAPPEVDMLVERIARAVDKMVEQSYLDRRLEELDQITMFREAFAGLGYHLPAELLRDVVELDHDAIASSLQVEEQTLDTLAYLKRQGYRMGMVSNVTLLPHKMHEDVRRLGLSEYMEAITFSSELGVRKPDPRIFLETLRRMGVTAARSVFVGDRLLDDVAGAQALGMRTILTRQFRQEDPSDIKPDAVVERFSEIPNALDQIF
jgi:HAD superfamily hydrolase (TIGR01662 family)